MNEIEMLFVEWTDREHYGLRVVEVDGEDFAVADNEEQADAAARRAAGDSLWAFNTDFIGRFLGLSDAQKEAIGKMQQELCEGAQEVVEMLLGDRRREFLQDAIDADGRGHFLNGYDGEEYDGSEVSPALEGKLVYRV